MDDLELQTAEVNGVELAFLEKGEGRLALCIHGYPDTARTWDATVPLLADAGHRAVAMYQRGYAPSGIPADADYRPLTLGRDVLALMDVLEAEDAVLIGHDWGALAAYAATSLDPSRVYQLVTLAIPHPRAIRLSLKLAWTASHFIHYQLPWAAWKVRRNDFAHLEALYRYWSPQWEFDPDEELADVRRAFSEPGVVEAAIGYYRSFRRTATDRETNRVLRSKIDVPALSFFGTADGALGVDGIERTKRAFTGRYEIVWIEGAGHFLHREKPDAFHERLLDFLDTP